MKVILRKDFDQLGKVGELVEVKSGYARNFLIPEKIAVLATSRNMKALEEEQRLSKIRESKDRVAAEKLSKELETVSLTITAVSYTHLTLPTN